MEFYKYHGSGNDFVLLDGFERDYDLTEESIQILCHRRLGIGSDGLIIIKESDEADFTMEFYNPDGSTGMLCGNGARCAILLAATLGYVSDEMTFLAADGLHKGVLHDDTTVSLSILPISEIQVINKDYFMNSGTPHLVRILKSGIENYDIFNVGRGLRNDKQFQPSGTNVNFIQQVGVNQYKIRTYEKGVENETLACGTGVTASAIAAHYASSAEEGNFTYMMQTLIGHLQVSFQADGKKEYRNIWLKGPAMEVFQGKLNLKAIHSELIQILPDN